MAAGLFLVLVNSTLLHKEEPCEDWKKAKVHIPGIIEIVRADV